MPQSSGLLSQRITCYSVSDATAGTPMTSPRYLTQGTVWGRITSVAGDLQYQAAQAGEVLDAILSVRDTAPVSKDGLVAYQGTYYLVTAVMPLFAQKRLSVKLKQVERELFPVDDAPVASLVAAPLTVSVTHGTVNALGATTVTALDTFGFALTGRFYLVMKTAGSSTVTGVMRGNLLDLHGIPNAPATGDVFTVYSEGQSTTVAVTVT